MWLICIEDQVSITYNNDVCQNVHILVSEDNLQEYLRRYFWETVANHQNNPTSLDFILFPFANLSKNYSNCIIRCTRDDKFIFAVYAKWVIEYKSPEYYQISGESP